MTQGGERDIDLLLASLRADAADTHAFLQALAVKLDGALPGGVQIERQSGLFSHDQHVKRIEVELGESRYDIAEESHGRLRAQRARVVRGIALKTEELTADQWIAALASDLETLAKSSSRAREALERLLLDRP